MNFFVHQCNLYNFVSCIFLLESIFLLERKMFSLEILCKYRIHLKQIGLTIYWLCVKCKMTPWGGKTDVHETRIPLKKLKETSCTRKFLYPYYIQYLRQLTRVGYFILHSNNDLLGKFCMLMFDTSELFIWLIHLPKFAEWNSSVYNNHKIM